MKEDDSVDERLLDLLRDLAADLEAPDPERSLLSEIRDLGDQTVPLFIDAILYTDPRIRRMAAFCTLAVGGNGVSEKNHRKLSLPQSGQTASKFRLLATPNVTSLFVK
jgi:hypothetical protein